MSIKVIKTRMDVVKTWLPMPSELFLGERNPNYFESLVAGVFSPIFHLPYIAWFNIIYPVIAGLGRALAFISVSVIGGLLGRASGRRMVAIEELKLTDKEMEEQLDMLLKDTGYLAVKMETVRRLQIQEYEREKQQETLVVH